MSIHYWNRDNFEGLSEIAAALKSVPRFEALGMYCELRERGLRQQAFAALESFLRAAASADVEDQREMALTILAIHWNAPTVHQFLSEPIRRQFIEPVLENWRRDEPNAGEAIRALALLRRDVDMLKRLTRSRHCWKRMRFSKPHRILPLGASCWKNPMT